MRIRTIDEVINGIRRGINAISPELATFPKFGNLYAIIRGISSAVTELEVGIQDEFNRLSVSKAKGDDLDTLSKDYGLVRFNGTSAQGYVLVSNLNDSVIQKGTILSNATKDIQYEVINNVNLQVGVEVPIYIRSLTRRSFTNLTAGNYLYSRIYPGAQIVVGQYRDSRGSAIGNLSGGSDPEDDASLRTRMIDFLNGSYNALSPLNIQARLRNNFGTREIYIKDTLNTPGMFYVYTSFRDNVLRKELLDLIYRIKPIGVVPVIRTFNKSRIDISLTVKVSSYNYIGQITTQIDEVIEQYVNSLGIGDMFNVSELGRRLSLIPYTKGIIINSPILNEVPSNNILITLGDVDKTIVEED